MKKVVMLILILFICSFVACSSSKHENIPVLNVTCNGNKIEVLHGSYNWNKKSYNVKSYASVIDKSKAENVSSKGKINFKFNYLPSKLQIDGNIPDSNKKIKIFFAPKA